MKKLSAVGVLVLGLAFCLSSAPAHAQDDMGKISLFGGYSYLSSSTPSCFDCEFDTETTGLHGYNGAIVYNLSKHVGIEANFDGHNGTPTLFSEPAGVDEGEKDVARIDSYSYTFGPKLTQSFGHFSVFAHFLVGGAHVHTGFSDTCLSGTNEEENCGTPATDTGNFHGNGFAFKTGGGVDWNHGHWGLRILEVDYERVASRITEHEDGDSFGPETGPASANNVSLSTGITFNFGGMK